LSYMQHMIETPTGQRDNLPLPSAALVIDTRGANDDTVIEWLRMEIADLTDEMRMEHIHHWRYLSQFLSFKIITPLRGADGQAAPHSHTGQQRGLIGVVPPSQLDEQGQELAALPVEQQIAELMEEINRIRNNHFSAVQDGDIAGIIGNSTKDETVRVIFLADVTRAESLTTAAIYAEGLKGQAQRLARTGYAPLINTTVLCLGHPGEGGPPDRLIHGLMRNQGWEHLDSLILCEDYRRDAANIAGPMQAYLAELLLYVLLVIPPFGVDAAAAQDGNAAQNGQSGTNGTAKEKSGMRTLTLPAHTYVVGLAALEYSARWGRRWLNFGLAGDVVEKLRRELPDEEKRGIRQMAEDWFNGWRIRVLDAITEHAPDDAPALHGLARARQTNESNWRSFTSSEFSLNIGKSTLSDLQEYLAALAKTYVSTRGEPSLQSALLQGAPQVIESLRAREHKSAAERQVIELGKLQIEAEQVPGAAPFFTAATSAVPRALEQLARLGSIIHTFLDSHQAHPLHPAGAQDSLQARRQALEHSGNQMIEDFRKHLEGWPFFGSLLLLKQTFAVLTLLIFMFLTLVTILLSFAWLHHLLVMHSVQMINAALQGIPVLELCAWLLALLFMGGAAAASGPRLLNKNRSGLRVEVVFVVALLVFALFGLLINFSIENLLALSDDTSIGYIAWLALVPNWSAVVVVIAVLIVFAEGLYCVWWLRRLHTERERIIDRMREQHRNDVRDVTDFIAGEVALDILKGAQLIDKEGELGDYFLRMERLNNMLEEVANQAKHQHFLAAQRLFLSQSDIQPTGPTSAQPYLNLHIRDERLEIPILTGGYNAVKAQFEGEPLALQELAEFLLRAQGVEKVIEIERDLAERPTQMTGEQRHLHLFTIAVAALIMRFCVDPLSGHNLAAITYYHQRLGERSLQQIPALDTLIETINQAASQTTLASASASSDTSYSEPAGTNLHRTPSADALAIWVYLFWRDKHPQLRQALLQEGVLAQLSRQLRHNYDPRTIIHSLLNRSVPFGRSQGRQPLHARYLLLPPSSYSYRFRQGLKHMLLPRIIDFPDPERILLLDIQQYVAEPLLLPAPAAQQDQDTKQDKQDANVNA
jgi:hypothetical protein